jgi:hypothetical protein
MLALLIPGKYKVCNMDVYLAPLVEELQLLWEGVQMVDMSRSEADHQFRLRAILMWTMHDFPGFGECSGKNLSIFLFHTSGFDIIIKI